MSVVVQEINCLSLDSNPTAFMCKKVLVGDTVKLVLYGQNSPYYVGKICEIGRFEVRILELHNGKFLTIPTGAIAGYEIYERGDMWKAYFG